MSIPYTFTQKAKRVLDSLDYEIKERCYKKLDELYNDPIPHDKKNILLSHGGYLFCKINIDKIRIYYLFKSKKLVIMRIIIWEISKSHKAGSKGNYNRQQKDINRMKKEVKKTINEENKEFKKK